VSEKIKLLIQMRYTTELRNALTATKFSTSAVPSLDIPGLSLDENYTPVKIPKRETRKSIGDMEVGRLFTFDARPEVSTYLIRGEVEDENSLDRLTEKVEQDPSAVAVHSDARIGTCPVCPDGPVGSHEDVAHLLNTTELHANGMDGTNVMVAIMDTGIKMEYLRSKGISANFDESKSWSPLHEVVFKPGNFPKDHGTMCAFDVCIAAPNCTLLDYALLRSQKRGETATEGFLSDAIIAYSKLLELLSTDEQNKPRLVVSNSWGMFHPSWDFPVDHPGNYSDNPDHPFNIIVESLEEAGADIIFSAGNCGEECADNRCENVTDKTIYGANSHPNVLCVAAVTTKKERLGYSSKGPGRLDPNKPDICAYSHFRGSEVYPADSGTSAACPVAAGAVAAIRSVYSLSDLSPVHLRNKLRRTAEDLGQIGFDYSHGYGLINTREFITPPPKPVIPIQVGEPVSGNLRKTGESAMFKVTVKNALNVVLDGPEMQDFDLYVRKGAEPTTTHYDDRGYTGTAKEKIEIPLDMGEYYIMVHSFRGDGDFSLRTIVE